MPDNNAEQLKRIVDARDALKDAVKSKCTCGGFSLQYDGCGCDKVKVVKRAGSELQSAIDALQITVVDKDVLITNEE